MNDPQRPHAEEDLEEALQESFPASDPPANTVETGIRVAVTPPPTAAADVVTVTDRPEARRFELVKDGQTAFLNYTRTGDALTLVHTEVPAALRGQHLAEALVKAALDVARLGGLRIIPSCPFVAAYLRKHPQADLRIG